MRTAASSWLSSSISWRSAQLVEVHISTAPTAPQVKAVTTQASAVASATRTARATPSSSTASARGSGTTTQSACAAGLADPGTREAVTTARSPSATPTSTQLINAGTGLCTWIHTTWRSAPAARAATAISRVPTASSEASSVTPRSSRCGRPTRPSTTRLAWSGLIAGPSAPRVVLGAGEAVGIEWVPFCGRRARVPESRVRRHELVMSRSIEGSPAAHAARFFALPDFGEIAAWEGRRHPGNGPGRARADVGPEVTARPRGRDGRLQDVAWPGPEASPNVGRPGPTAGCRRGRARA